MPEFYHQFAVSGVSTWLWLPPLVAFAVSFFTSMAGVSGAFLLLPFQVSVLNFATPSVSATNLVYNLAATPGGIYRYFQEGRLLWPLALVISLGSLPGITIGYGLRVTWLADAGRFQVFVGAVLAFIAYRTLADFLPWARRPSASDVHPAPGAMTIAQVRRAGDRLQFDFQGQSHGFSLSGMFLLALMVGVVGGIYGIGGGAIIAPFCVAIFRLPIHVVAGAALTGTLVSSIAGVAIYSLLPAPAGLATQPDWALGLLFGLGGLAGMYAGAGFQKHVPQRTLKAMLGVLLAALAVGYLASGV
jgi:hypothetical protein